MLFDLIFDDRLLFGVGVLKFGIENGWLVVRLILVIGIFIKRYLLLIYEKFWY